LAESNRYLKHHTVTNSFLSTANSLFPNFAVFLDMREKYKIIYCFIVWWFEQLYSLLPRGKKHNTLFQGNDALLIVDKDGYELQRPDGSISQYSALNGLIQSLQSRQTGSRKKRLKSILVVLKEKQYLYRALSNSYLPDYRIAQLAAFDISSHTPFKQHEVMLIPDSQHGRGKGYYIVKKSILIPLFESLHNSGLSCERISFWEKPFLFNLPSRSDISSKLPHTGKKSLVFLTVFAVFAMLILTIGHFHWRYSVAIEKLDASIASLDIEVSALRQKLAKQDKLETRLANVLKLKRNAPSKVEIWEELARVMPDSTWLAALTIKDEKVMASGYSKSAASLIEIVSSSPLFEKVGFDGPVVSIAGKDIQRFTMRAEVASK